MTLSMKDRALSDNSHGRAASRATSATSAPTAILARTGKALAAPAISGRSKQAARPRHEHDQEERISDRERQSGIDVVAAQRLGDAEQQARRQAAEHVADTPHDHDHKRLHVNSMPMAGLNDRNVLTS